MAKLEDMKNISPAKIVQCGFVFLMGVVTLLALCFTLLRDQYGYGYGFKMTENGFGLLDFESKFIGGGYRWGSTVMGILCVLQLIISILVIVGAVLSFFFSGLWSVKKVCKISVTMCMIFLFLYMAEGIVFAVIYDSEESGGTTFSYIPFILGIALIIAYKVLSAYFEDKNRGSQNTGRFITSNKLQDLETLQKLREAGVLTEEEFQEQKNKILGGDR